MYKSSPAVNTNRESFVCATRTGAVIIGPVDYRRLSRIEGGNSGTIYLVTRRRRKKKNLLAMGIHDKGEKPKVTYAYHGMQSKTILCNTKIFTIASGQRRPWGSKEASLHGKQWLLDHAYLPLAPARDERGVRPRDLFFSSCRFRVVINASPRTATLSQPQVSKQGCRE